ncbi:MAG: hypothetical protein OXC44_07115 [Proteobacteria bacterium]|nr:hypothetical protein [Pseudomonadota bacterium]
MFVHHLGTRLCVIVLLCVVIILSSRCRTDRLQEPVVEEFALSSTANDNHRFGQEARCYKIYRHKNLFLSSLSCEAGLWRRDIFGFQSLGKPGVYGVSVDIFSHILSLGKVENSVAQLIIDTTPTFLKNMMADEERPIHPAAFFSVIKDYETGANVYEWGRTAVNCQTPGMCTNKCVQGDDCLRWCLRHSQMMGEQETCKKACMSEQGFCDDRCYGLFQVDPEIANFVEKPQLNGKSSLELVAAEHIHWDYEKICGASGLDLIGRWGGPDYCAVLFWLFAARSGYNCTFFINEKKTQVVDGELKVVTNTLSTGEEAEVYVNPCTDEGYVWSIDTFAQAHKAYHQQNRDHAWAQKYAGFMSEQGPVYGYEHCAAEGFGGYHYRQTNSLEVPPEVLQRSVLEFACKVGVLPKWADSQDCPK